ncbi:MAG: leucine-rich repeat domain-containing protein [bacterium]|nr:leucine-rich repeat domain-containing protein [bacterium]
MKEKDLIGRWVRNVNNELGQIRAITEFIVVDFGHREATYQLDSLEKGFLRLDPDGERIAKEKEEQAKLNQTHKPEGYCEKCGCPLTDDEEYCPCCADFNPYYESRTCEKCGWEYYRYRPICPICKSINPEFDCPPEYIGDFIDDYEEPSLEERDRELEYNNDPYSAPQSETVYGSIVPARAFENRQRLYQVILSKQCHTIGYEAFHGCEMLRNIVLPDGLERIGPEAFRGCSGLVEITIPKSVNYIGPGAFSNCPSLTTIVCYCKADIVPDSAFDSFGYVNFVEE